MIVRDLNRRPASWVSPLQCASLGPFRPKNSSSAIIAVAFFAMPARTELDAREPRGESFGIVYLEAMAHGKAVVGPRVGAPAESIRDGEHGLLVDRANAVEVANALTELLEDPERARRMGEAAKEVRNARI